VIDPSLIGNGNCNDYSPYNSTEYGLDGGDCIKDKGIANSTIIALLAVSLAGGVLLIIPFLLGRKRRGTKLSKERKAQVENKPVSSEEEEQEEEKV